MRFCKLKIVKCSRIKNIKQFIENKNLQLKFFKESIQTP